MKVIGNLKKNGVSDVVEEKLQRVASRENLKRQYFEEFLLLKKIRYMEYFEVLRGIFLYGKKINICMY